MRALSAIALLASWVVLAACGGGGSGGGGSVTNAPATSAPKSVHVQIKDFDYAPKTVTVKAGGSVTWTNHDAAPHTSTAKGDSGFDTGTINKGQSKRIRFDKPGTYSYVCLFHAFMVGKVVVK